MKFHLGKIPETDFKPDEKWKPLREPGPIVMQLCAIPIGAIVAFAVGSGWSLILHQVPQIHVTGHAAIAVPLMFLISIPLVIIVHEFIHALFHPHCGRTDESAVGLWPSRLVFYAMFTGEHSRDRFLAILIAPFFLISLLPLAFFSCFPTPLGTIAAHLAAFCSTFNALAACGDLFGVALLLCQVPRGAITRNQGWRTFWKRRAPDS